MHAAGMGTGDTPSDCHAWAGDAVVLRRFIWGLHGLGQDGISSQHVHGRRCQSGWHMALRMLFLWAAGPCGGDRCSDPVSGCD